ncbi:hypothetical protein [Blastochloris viridis]|uniref:Uncharacterized protein n=1 Tax=Blastochloris viridis TaxID=1079 RepID=A0A0H5BCR6_BLAVI|nr:hypothetical protein [Blastochloris viridis]ALK08610.1 hypothetical protein BVIR_817 [Blastochloris viridis]BAR98101.1 hypothetical protein BV133_508 [Blastochloris viridis]CUU41273.1 hypothetical protein BVIRIDIS_02620 [Blastochloris viridis]
MSFHRLIMFLIFLTAQAMVFGLGTAVVVITPSLMENGNVWLPVVNVSSFVIAAVAAWLITPVVRARYAAKRRVAVLAETTRPDRAA